MNSPKPPDKGSFPLDHFKECSNEATEYNKCLSYHQSMPRKCKIYQKNYLECRMEKGLMQKEDFSKLGLDSLNFKSEDEEKNKLMEHMKKIKLKAYNKLTKNNYDYEEIIKNE